jgi:glycosyltransferase involved in cell wall biosynthesis
LDHTLRALYVCYLSLEDPLVHTQVVAYLEGLAARGHTIHLLTFDHELEPERRDALENDLRSRGISWHSLRYHKRPSLPATIYDVLAGSITATRLIRRYGLTAIHARNHVPAAMALIARRLTGCRFIFDIRGLMAEEYVDAGRWRRGGVPYRLTNWIQRAAIRRADGLVMLTDAVRRHLFPAGHHAPLEVIPCCADTERLAAAEPARDSTREELQVGERPILVYVGKFTGWYLDREMVEFFVTAREELPSLLLLVISQAEHGLIAAELEKQGVAAADHRILRASPAEVARYLAAADIGISLIRPCFSKISSSPTKIGEYLGAGLPVVSTAGIGDVDQLLGSHTGVLISELSRDAYRRAAVEVRRLLEDPETSERCRTMANERLSLRDVGIPPYDHLYRRVAELS